MQNRAPVNYRVVVRSPKTVRGIFLNPQTRRQLAVMTHLESDKYKLSIPIEGMGGWHVVMPSFKDAVKVAHREMSIQGKLFNRTIFMVSALLFHDLH